MNIVTVGRKMSIITQNDTTFVIEATGSDQVKAWYRDEAGYLRYIWGTTTGIRSYEHFAPITGPSCPIDATEDLLDYMRDNGAGCPIEQAKWTNYMLTWYMHLDAAGLV